MKPIKRFEDIPQLTPDGNYRCNVGWDFMFAEDGWLANQIKVGDEMSGLNLSPDFQRGHVWTEAQQVAYVEYRLRGGHMSGREIYFNHPGWMKSFMLFGLTHTEPCASVSSLGKPAR